MESADLNSSDPESVALERLLRAPAPLLPDDGFSSRVLTALPPARRRFVQKTLVCCGGALAGVACASLQGLTWGDWQSVPQQTLALILSAIPRLTDPRFALALVATFLSLLFAFRHELKRRLSF